MTPKTTTETVSAPTTRSREAAGATHSHKRIDTPASVTGTPATSASDLTAKHTSEHEEIAVLAFRYWEERGRPEGSPEEDWFRAEQEIRARRR